MFSHFYVALTSFTPFLSLSRWNNLLERSESFI